MNRRRFLAAIGLSAFAPGWQLTHAAQASVHFAPLRIGMCADLHQDLIFDAPSRLTAFMDTMTKKMPDFIIQLGDFCFPDPRNKVIMDIWNRFPGRKYHVIGNHDPEGKFTQDEVVDFWKAEGKYYSFDLKGYHFVVLNGNETNPSREIPWKYERYISQQQIEWLESDIDASTSPVIIFCHQGLDNEIGGIENSLRIRLAFENANTRAGFRKVQVVFTGHHHQDYHNFINGIHYVQINSMSYHWQGNKYAESPFPGELNKKYPSLKYMAHYQDPLWAFVDINENGMLTLTGKQSCFAGRSPAELGMPVYEYGYPVVPHISDRKFQLTKHSFIGEDHYS